MGFNYLEITCCYLLLSIVSLCISCTEI